jgi:hypothetical protein
VLDEHPSARAANAIRLQLLISVRLARFSVRAKNFDLERGVWTHQAKQKRTEHIPLSTHGLVLVASIIGTSDSNSPILFPGNKPGQALHETKKF